MSVFFFDSYLPNEAVIALDNCKYLYEYHEDGHYQVRQHCTYYSTKRTEHHHRRYHDYGTVVVDDVFVWNIRLRLEPAHRVFDEGCHYDQ